MLTLLNPHDRNQTFPDVDSALDEPNGLLAIGGCLSPRRLENAYRHGIFPWYSRGEPILWWSPDPRLILLPDQLKISRSMRKVLRRQEFQFSFDAAFSAVIDGCAEPRRCSRGTWITADVKKAYVELHRLGLAHSFEVWKENRLVGGLYGVAIGRVFFGESMFHRLSNASKAGFTFAVGKLQQWNYALIDCQVHTEHLASLGAEPIPRADFIRLLSVYCAQKASSKAWQVLT
jgi:leucyl/phenylalanyl-tRNA--protein transferase